MAMKRLCRSISVALLTFLLLVCLPPFLLVLSPIYLYRILIGKLNLIFYSGKGKILSTKSAIFAADDIHGKPKSALLVFLLIEGQLNLEEIREQGSKTVLKTGANGKLVYPELQQHIDHWGGFSVWRQDSEFKLSNHIVKYDDRVKVPVVDEQTLPRIVNDLTNRPFARGRSPWDVNVLHNVGLKTFEKIPLSECTAFKNPVKERPVSKDGQTLIVFRVHHALADGVSLRTFLLDVIGYQMKPLKRNSKRESTSVLKLVWKTLRVIFYPVMAPYQAIDALFGCNDVNSWHLPASKLHRELSSSATPALSVDFIKGLKNHFGVNFATVLLTAIAGGIRNFMVNQGVEVPQTIHCLTPLPMPGHSSKLRNHLTAAAVRLPLKCDTPIERLQNVGTYLARLQNSLVPSTNYLIYPLIGGLFPCMIKRLFQHNYTTALMSSFQGPEEKIYFLGREIQEIVFTGGLLEGRIGVGITLLSYDGMFRVLVGVDKSIIPAFEQADLLVQYIYQEFFVLRDLQSV